MLKKKKLIENMILYIFFPREMNLIVDGYYICHKCGAKLLMGNIFLMLNLVIQ